MPIDQTRARENARRLAAMRGLTFRELAERAGLAVGTLYGWSKSNAPKDLGPKGLMAVAEALGVSTDDLFSGGLAEGGEGAVDRAGERPHTPADASEHERQRQSTLREIDYLLAGIDDPDEQERAADIILAALRAARDDFERRRAVATGARRAGQSPARGASRGPGRTR